MRIQLWPTGPMLALLALAALAPRVHAQMQWTQRFPGSVPPLRSRHAMVYDQTRRCTVLFGDGYPSYPNDTWEWNGNDWRLLIPATSPPPMVGCAMAYDTSRQRVVLFGQDRNGSPTSPNQTWEWDGANWTQKTTAISPPSQGGAAMSGNAPPHQVILFGGALEFSALNDTWSWDGLAWTRLTPAMAPPARHSHAMAYDAARKCIVLFGGRSHACLSDTWEWQGTTWIPCAPPSAPSPRHGHAMVYDTTRQRVILFGGNDDTRVFNDTWEWDGATWNPLSSSRNPAARGDHAMAHDEARQSTLLFGGNDGGTFTFNDMWDLAGTHLTSFGLPRPGTLLTFTLQSPHDAGRPFQLASSLGTGPVRIGPVNIGLDLDALLFNSISGLWPGVFHGYQGLLDGNGQATAGLQIPASSSLVGITVHSAYLTFTGLATPPIRSVSDTASFQVIP